MQREITPDQAALLDMWANKQTAQERRFQGELRTGLGQMPDEESTHAQLDTILSRETDLLASRILQLGRRSGRPRLLGGTAVQVKVDKPEGVSCFIDGYKPTVTTPLLVVSAVEPILDERADRAADILARDGYVFTATGSSQRERREELGDLCVGHVIQDTSRGGESTLVDEYRIWRTSAETNLVMHGTPTQFAEYSESRRPNHAGQLQHNLIKAEELGLLCSGEQNEVLAGIIIQARSELTS